MCKFDYKFLFINFYLKISLFPLSTHSSTKVSVSAARLISEKLAGGGGNGGKLMGIEICGLRTVSNSVFSSVVRKYNYMFMKKHEIYII